MKELSTRCVALLCVVFIATVAAVSVWPTPRDVRAEDRNGDGRPDIWRQYDDREQVTEVSVDSNFDGRSDIQEYYDRGVLVRRESDRNFDDHVDLVEEFDGATREHVRSVIDVDYDGIADLLVLFHNGRPVFSRQAHPLTVDLRPRGAISTYDFQLARRRATDPLAPLTDPFRTDTTVRGTRAASSSADCVGLSTSGGLPGSSVEAVSPMPSSARLVARDVQPHALTLLLPRSPRGPPLS
jgi:hypothetical protein